MPEKKLLSEKDLAALAKHFREESGKSRSEAGRDMGVSHVSIYRAEEHPEESLSKLRGRMIETYSSFSVVGPVFHLRRK